MGIAVIVTVAGLAALPGRAHAAEPVPKASPPIVTRGPVPHCGALARGESAFKTCIDAQTRLDVSNHGQPITPAHSSP